MKAGIAFALLAADGRSAQRAPEVLNQAFRLTSAAVRSSPVMRAALRRAVLGLVLGAVGGGLALMIAFGRANLVASGGRSPGVIPPDHVTFAPFFLMGFALGGVVLGLFAPLRKTPLGSLALGLVAAAGFVAAIFIGLAGPVELWSSSTWWVAGTATLVVGVVLGGQIQAEERAGTG